MKCDDCGKDAGIVVCTGCWEKAKETARALAMEEAARHMETHAWASYAPQIRALVSLPSTLVAVPVETLEEMRKAHVGHDPLDCCCEVHNAANGLLEPHRLALLKAVKP